MVGLAARGRPHGRPRSLHGTRRSRGRSLTSQCFLGAEREAEATGSVSRTRREAILGLAAWDGTGSSAAQAGTALSAGPARSTCRSQHMVTPRKLLSPLSRESQSLLIPGPSARRAAVGAPVWRWSRSQQLRWPAPASAPTHGFLRSHVVLQRGRLADENRRTDRRLVGQEASWMQVSTEKPLLPGGGRHGGQPVPPPERRRVVWWSPRAALLSDRAEAAKEGLSLR